MKLKNVTFLEKHAEKLVIVLTLAVLAAALYFYGLNTPNTVTISSQTVTPAEVDPLVAAEARQLKARLDANKVDPDLENRKVPPYTGDFVARIDQPLLQPGSFGVAMGPIPTTIQGIEDGPIDPYYVPTVPQPEIIAARADLGTIVPEEVANVPELAAMFAAGAPADKAWASISARFDLGKMLEELTHEPTEGVRPLPEDWWASTFAIVDVQIERQQQRPDGTWPAEGDADYTQLTALVKPFPGQLSLREFIAEEVNQDQGAEFVRLLQQFQQQIIQPPFFNLRGAAWLPPDAEDLEAGQENERVVELRSLIKKNERLIDGYMRRIEQIRNPGAARPAAAPRPAMPAPDEFMGEFGGAPRGRNAAPTPAPVRANASERLITRFQEQIKAKQEENAKYQEEFAKLTGKQLEAPRSPVVAPGMMPAYDEFAPPPEFMDPGMMGEFGGSYPGRNPYAPYPPGVRPGAAPVVPGQPTERITAEEFRRRLRGNAPGAVPGAPGAPIAPAVRQNVGPLVLDPTNDNKVDLWAIDFQAQPGQTYRYRVRVGVVNPLFNKTNLPKEQLEEHQSKFLLFSNYSDWTKPVTIERLQHFFVIGGNRNPAPGSVSFEVWKFHDGLWRNEEFRAAPGDPIGGLRTVRAPGIEPADVDFYTGAVLVDADFEFPVPGRIGNVTQKTLRALVMHDNQIVMRRRDLDNRDPKLDWLKTQKDIVANAAAFP